MRRSLSRFNARLVEAYQAGPTHTSGVLIRAAAGGQPAEILIYDVIGADFWGDGVTAKGVLAALTDAAGAPVRVRVNSPGGDVFEGLAIYNSLKGYPGAVDVVVDGLAASAASVIAMAGSSVTMNEGALMMIHNASTIAYGNRNDFTATADTLGKVDGQLAGIYSRFTGKSIEDCAGMMDAETYMTADEAKTGGFATAVAAAPAKPKAAAPAAPITAAAPDPEVESRRRRVRLARAC